MKTMKFVYEAPSTNLVVLRLRRVVLQGSGQQPVQNGFTGEDLETSDGQW